MINQWTQVALARVLAATFSIPMMAEEDKKAAEGFDNRKGAVSLSPAVICRTLAYTI